ncbi:MAG: Imm52 family immunity protein [Bacteroidota bacterium]
MYKFTSLVAHWGQRREDIKIVSQRIVDFLGHLKQIQPDVFGQWYYSGMSREESLERIMDITVKNVMHELTASKEERFDNLPLSFGGWNGADTEEGAASMSFAMNGLVDFAKNNCVLRLPYGGSHRDFFLKKENQDRLIELMKETWNPDYIMVDREKIWKRPWWKL